MKVRSKLSTFIVVIAITIFISSCATIIHGTKHNVGISSNPTGAEVTIDGQYYGTTPVTADLARKNDHFIEIDLEGFLPYSTPITHKVSGWIAGNIIFGGLIGLAIDAISGGMYKLTPDQIHAELREKGFGVNTDLDKILIMVVLEPNPTWEKVDTLKRLE